jgi:hypothetical protein
MRRGAMPGDVRLYAALRQNRVLDKPTELVRSASGVKEQSVAGSEHHDAILRGREMLEAIQDAKLRRARALAIKAELEIERLRSELIPRVYVREWSTRFLAYSRGLLLKGPSELGDALASESDPARVSGILRDWVDRTLAEFYQSDELWGASEAK